MDIFFFFYFYAGGVDNKTIKTEFFYFHFGLAFGLDDGIFTDFS